MEFTFQKRHRNCKEPLLSLIKRLGRKYKRYIRIYTVRRCNVYDTIESRVFRTSSVIRIWRVELIENSTTLSTHRMYRARVVEPELIDSVERNPSLHRLHRHRVQQRSGGATSRACNISGSPDSSPSTGALVIPLGRGRYRIILRATVFYARSVESVAQRPSSQS